MTIESVTLGLTAGAVRNDTTLTGASAGSPSALDATLVAARSGSPVEQGAALRALDTATGDTRLSNALVAGEAAPAGGAAAADSCTIEVRYNPVIGPANHAFIVTTDGDSVNYFRGGPEANNTGLNSPSSGSTAPEGAQRPAFDPSLGIYGPIVTEYGAYRPGTVDWTTQPSGQQTVAQTPGSCDRIETEFARHMDDIEAARINYMPLSQNSNSTVRETLERAGFPDVSPVVWAPAWGAQLPGPR